MIPDERPTFSAVRKCFFEHHGISLVHKQPFKNDDLTICCFERGGVSRFAEYSDGDLIDAHTIEGWCRAFGIKPSELHIECGDGHVSVKPPSTRPRLPSSPDADGSGGVN